MKHLVHPIPQFDDDDELPLTRENVELVLDEMRPYLKADGYDSV